MEIGNTLKSARESLGMSMELAEERTKIRRKYLEAMEDERFDVLPGRVYVKGFLKNYASFLGLDPKPLLMAFEENSAPERDEDLDAKEFTSLEKSVSGKTIWKAALGITVIALVAALIYLPQYTGGDKATTPSGPGNKVALDKKAQPETDATKQDSSPVTQQGVNLILNVTDRESWMHVEVDGKSIFEGLVSAGQVKTFNGSEKINLRLGNAGVVEVEFNGQKIGVLGEQGQVITKEFKATQS